MRYAKKPDDDDCFLNRKSIASQDCNNISHDISFHIIQFILNRVVLNISSATFLPMNFNNKCILRL